MIIKPLQNKKIVAIVVLIVLLSAGIIALTQEVDLELPDPEKSEFVEVSKESEEEAETEDAEETDLTPRKPSLWFRSNSGGMALEETDSRFIAQRNEYALVIDFPRVEGYPERLLPYIKDEYEFEIRSLYRNGVLLRSQWIFKDENGITRLNGVFIQPKDAGFIEVFDEKSFLTSEIRFLESGGQNKVDYEAKDNLIISAHVLDLDVKTNNFVPLYTDLYLYNRSLSLRAVERVFSKNTLITDPLRITFPRRLMDALKDDFLSSQRLNLYPDFFGDIFILAQSKMIFDTDNRGRIISQTLLDAEDKVVWIIRSRWVNDRIISTEKTEGDTVLRAEYEYASNGDRIVERNLRDGKLERVVRINNKTEMEDLYYDGVLVLQAVWEDGKKIAETRVRN